MGWLASNKGPFPVPWEAEVETPQTARSKPPMITLEGQFLRRIAWGQYLAVGAVLLGCGGVVHSWQLGTKIKTEYVPYVIEVNRRDAPEGEIRNIGVVPQRPYADPDIGVQVHVIYFWLWYLRSVGDSTVLQGQGWQNALAFTDDSLHGWVQHQIAERRKIFVEKATVQIRAVEILPIVREARQFRVTWIEEKIALNGDVGAPVHVVAGITLAVKPPPTIEGGAEQALQKALAQKNTLGIVVKEINYLEINGRRL